MVLLRSDGADVPLEDRRHGFVPVGLIKCSSFPIGGQYNRLNMRDSVGLEHLPGGAVEQRRGLPGPVLGADVEPNAGGDRGVLRPHEGHHLDVHVPYGFRLVVDHEHHVRRIQGPAEDAVVGHEHPALIHASGGEGILRYPVLVEFSGESPEVGEVGMIGDDDVH